MQFGEGEREFESDSVRDGTITIRAEFRPAE
jgi:hypothetical protein